MAATKFKRPWIAFALTAIVTAAAVVISLNFVTPETRIDAAPRRLYSLQDPQFRRAINSLLGPPIVAGNKVDTLRNGDEIFPAMLAAIRSAQATIDFETYVYWSGQIGRDFADAIAERARAGIKVNVLLDWAGSQRMDKDVLETMKGAGARVELYHPLRWYTLARMNNRTHRKLLIVDGETGFIGGAGIADQWLYSTPSVPVWRDTVFCVEGEAVAGLISAFCENWLESSGEILSSSKQFGFRPTPEGAESFVVSSTPHGGGTQARILFQALINSARRTIRITTPYFLPDRSARQALIEAIERGVTVQILTAGPFIDHKIIRTLSHRSVSHLLQAGAEIYEYGPSMIHAKLMTVDGLWSVVGSTNFDHRSFALNDEVNLAVLDQELAATIESDFFDDLGECRRLNLSELVEYDLLAEDESIVDHILRQES